LLLYLGSGIAGAAASVIGHDAVSAGASGALFGLIGARYVAWHAELGSWDAMFSHEVVRRDLMWTGAWFVLGAFAGFDNFAHGGGLAFGALFAWALRRQPRLPAVAAAAAALALLVALSLRPLPGLHASERALRDAEAALARKDYEGALAAVKRAPSSERGKVLHVELDALLKLQRWPELRDASSRAISTFPQWAPGHRSRGMAERQLGHPAEAEDAYTKALALEAKDAWTYLERAAARMQLGEWVKAEEDARSAIALAPDWVEAHRGYAWLLMQLHRNEEALAECNRSLELQPDSVPVLEGKATVLFELGRPDEATVIAEELSRKHPERPAAHQLLCYARLGSGELDAARELCAAGVKVAPDNESLLETAGWVELAAGHLDEAQVHFSAADAKAPSGGATAGLGLVALRRGDAKVAAEALTRAMKLEQDDPDVWLLKAELALASKDVEGARAAFRTGAEKARAQWVGRRTMSKALAKVVE
jgi:tetratricopeptide (TPR) repeat protein